MTDWTSCTPLTAEPDYWDADQVAIRRRLSGVAQGIEDLRAVAVHFKRDPDEAIAAWEAHARAADDDGMATFNRFLKRVQPAGPRSFRIPNQAHPTVDDVRPEIEDYAAAVGVGVDQIVAAFQAAFQPLYDSAAKITKILDDIRWPTGPDEPDAKPARLCYRCAEAHGSRPCRQVMRGRQVARR